VGGIFWRRKSVKTTFIDLIVRYAGLSNERAVEKVLAGYRLEQPKDCPNSIYKLMNDCWKVDPSSRPTFQQVRKICSFIHEDCGGIGKTCDITSIKSNSVKTHSLTLFSVDSPANYGHPDDVSTFPSSNSATASMSNSSGFDNFILNLIRKRQQLECGSSLSVVCFFESLQRLFITDS